ncbi:MAG: hypothetical protein RJP95_00615, partial [Pirellulales bacterium]
MASVYKKTIIVVDPVTGERVRRKSAKWWFKFRDSLGRIRRMPGFKDRSATWQMATKLERRAELARAGVIDEFEEYRKMPLLQQLEDYREYLTNQGRTEKQVHHVINRATRMLVEANLVYIGDVKGAKVAKAMAMLRKKGLSPRTVNHHRQALQQLFNWMVKEHRCPSNPISNVEEFNVEIDRRRVRRAATTKELSRLFKETANSACHHGLDGPDRAMLYFMAAFTGLRRGELASVTKRSLYFSEKGATITIDASYRKRRRRDVLPLHPDLAEK